MGFVYLLFDFNLTFFVSSSTNFWFGFIEVLSIVFFCIVKMLFFVCLDLVPFTVNLLLLSLFVRLLVIP